MARKSRKQIAVEEPVIEPVSSEVFSTAIYARLSVENSGKSEKVDVIANQIEICKSYIAERPYLNLIDTPTSAVLRTPVPTSAGPVTPRSEKLLAVQKIRSCSMSTRSRRKDSSPQSQPLS